jgi:hypothetical protein
MHELQSLATLANHYGHLAKIFEWRSAGDTSARQPNQFRHLGSQPEMSRSLLKFAERTLLFKSYAASAT